MSVGGFPNVDEARLMREPIDPATLAPEYEVCPTCGTRLLPCPSCDGEGVLIEFEDVGDPCDACRWTGVVCPNPECGGAEKSMERSNV